jgi:putative hydrolase of the HAD superfamily
VPTEAGTGSKTMDYSTLIFDAFDTTIHINESKLPTYQVNGKAVPTTAPAAHAAYAQLFGKLEFDAFYDAFSQSYMQTTMRRRADLREIPSQERFKIMLGLLGHASDEITDEVVETITKAHMSLLEDTFEVRPETVEVLEWAKARYRTAMISNFAYAPTLYSALDRFEIRSAFEKVIVSAEVGWCKPHRIIFDHTFQELGIQASDALFVGDQIYIDVYGALNCGMNVAWIQTERQDWMPPEVQQMGCQPTYTVQSISELMTLLEKRP